MHARAQLVLALSFVVGCASAPAARPPPREAGPPAPAAAPAAPPISAPATAPPAVPTAEMGLELAVEPATAQVFVDGELRGGIAELGSGILPLAPGIYQVSIKAPGYVTWRAEVAVRTGRERIDVKLARKDAAAR